MWTAKRSFADHQVRLASDRSGEAHAYPTGRSSAIDEMAWRLGSVYIANRGKICAADV